MLLMNDFNDENNFLYKLLLTNTQVLKLCKPFANNSSANIKLSKTQLHKIGKSGGFLGKLLGPLLKTGLPLKKNVVKPLAKNVLIPLRLTTAASAADIAIHEKMLGSGNMTLIISNEEINDIIKIIKSPGKSGLLMKGVQLKTNRQLKTIKNKAKKTKRISQ